MRSRSSSFALMTTTTIAPTRTPSQAGPEVAARDEEPGGFDCSGLVQAAYAATGISLPRTAQEQYDAGPPVPAAAPLQPGDLVFFGPDTEHVEHVGIVVNQTEMIDAPHTGALVPLARLSRRDAARRAERLISACA